MEIPDSLSGMQEPTEKVYLHIGQNLYQSGETIWFEVYLVDSKTNQPNTPSKVVYVDLLNPNQVPISSRIIHIDGENDAGDFRIPADAQPGEYTIRAYTRYMANFDPAWFFQKKICVTNAELEQPGPGTVLTFFPEGGNLVNGFINQIAFKAMNSAGKGIDISGSIVDQEGKEVQRFQTKKMGLGIVSFAPREDQHYKVRYTYNGYKYQCAFPVPADSGAVMQLIDCNDHYSVIVRSSLAHGTYGFQLVCRQRNRTVTSSRLDRSNNGAKFYISKKMFGNGIAQFTLLNEKGLPLCERLAFVESDEPVPLINIDSLKKEYNKDEPVELLITPTLSLANDVGINLSVSVANLSTLENANDALNIRSYLTLVSELKGKIEHPSYYLSSPDPERKSMLDLLMMTRDWPQFIINDSVPVKNIRYMPEKGLSFRGQIKRSGESEKPVNANVTLFYSDKQEEGYYETTTDKTGYFAFENLDFPDSTKVIIQAKKAGKKKGMNGANKNVDIVLNSLNVPTIIRKDKSNFNFPMGFQDKAGDKETASTGVQRDKFRLQKDTFLIDEVLINGKKQDPHQEKRSMYREPNYSIDFSDIRRYEGPSNLLDIVKQRTATRIFNELLSMPDGKSGPLFLLNGVPVKEETALAIPTSEIDFVDVLEGPKTIIYGSSGAHGVIAIYTLNASDVLKNLKTQEEKGILSFVYPGYSRARKFAPEKQSASRTIYWNPSVNINPKGKVSFRAPEKTGTYKITIEGITPGGKIIHSEKRFAVK